MDRARRATEALTPAAIPGEFHPFQEVAGRFGLPEDGAGLGDVDRICQHPANSVRGIFSNRAIFSR